MLVRKDIKIDKNTPRKGGIRCTYFQVVNKRKKKEKKKIITLETNLHHQKLRA